MPRQKAPNSVALLFIYFVKSLILAAKATKWFAFLQFTSQCNFTSWWWCSTLLLLQWINNISSVLFLEQRKQKFSQFSDYLFFFNRLGDDYEQSRPNNKPHCMVSVPQTKQWKCLLYSVSTCIMFCALISIDRVSALASPLDGLLASSLAPCTLRQHRPFSTITSTSPGLASFTMLLFYFAFFRCC